MKNILPRVALIFGGRGFERQVSVEGAKFLFPKIDGSLYEKILVFITPRGDWRTPISKNCSPEELALGKCDTVALAPACIGGVGGLMSLGAFLPISAAIPLLHGDFGEDGSIQGALESARIPYVGCGVRASAVCIDKAFTKIVAEHLGIKTVPWILAINESKESAKARAEESIGYPMFIKPSGLGSSIGASSVEDESEFEECYEKAARCEHRILIERRIDVKKELECAYFSQGSKEIFTKPGEITLGGGFYDYETKYFSGGTARTSVGGSLDAETEEKLISYARAIAELVGLRALSRIDFFLDSEGELYFNEINTFPGFTKSSLYPAMLGEIGISAENLVTALIEDARAMGA